MKSVEIVMVFECYKFTTLFSCYWYLKVSILGLDPIIPKTRHESCRCFTLLLHTIILLSIHVWRHILTTFDIFDVHFDQVLSPFRLTIFYLQVSWNLINYICYYLCDLYQYLRTIIKFENVDMHFDLFKPHFDFWSISQ